MPPRRRPSPPAIHPSGWPSAAGARTRRCPAPRPVCPVVASRPPARRARTRPRRRRPRRRRCPAGRAARGRARRLGGPGRCPWRQSRGCRAAGARAACVRLPALNAGTKPAPTSTWRTSRPPEGRRMNQLQDILDQDLDPTETQEWIDALTAVIDADGPERAHYLLERMVDETRRAGGHIPFSPTTAYVNTIPRACEAKIDGRRRDGMAHPLDPALERAGDGGAREPQPGEARRPHRELRVFEPTLYDVGFNHFWRAPSDAHPGDLLYIQGHSSPGIYARAFLEGRIRPNQIDHYRMEVDGAGHLELSAPVADAGFLADADRVDGPRADHRDLPGALLEVPRAAASCRSPTARSGASWATANPTSPNRWARSRSAGARSSTTWCSSSTATCSASTARCAATARSSRSSKARSAAPAGT